MKNIPIILISVLALAAGATALRSLRPGFYACEDTVSSYVIPLDAPASVRSRVANAARKEIWERWATHQPGTIDIVGFSKEGERTQSRFVIKDEPNGQHKVQIQIKRQLADIRTHTARNVIETHEAVSIDRVPESTSGKSRDLILIFKDEGGKVVTRL